MRKTVFIAALLFIATLVWSTLAFADTKTESHTDENGNTTTTTTTSGTYTTKDGGYYKENNVSVRVEDKNGKVVKKTRRRTRDYHNSNDEPGDYEITNWDSVPDGSGGSTESSSTITEHDDGSTGQSSETYHMDSGGNITSGERTHGRGGNWLVPPRWTWRERWDPDKKKWVSAGNISMPHDESSRITAVTPARGENTAVIQGSAALPPFAGPTSQIVINVEPNPAEGGASGVLVLAENQAGQQRYFRVKRSASGRIALLGGLLGKTLRTISLVTRVDKHGKPEIASRCEIGNPSHIPGTDVVAHPPAIGPAITETNSSAQPGDLVQAHISGNNPRNTSFTLDGQPVRTLGVSDNSAVIQVPQGTTLAHHRLVMESGGKRSNPISMAIVQLVPEPVAASQPGVVQTITIHVNGLAPGDVADMYFEVGGAAQMLDGSAAATSPVTAGVARVQLRGTRAGRALLQFRLHLRNSDFKA